VREPLAHAGRRAPAMVNGAIKISDVMNSVQRKQLLQIFDIGCASNSALKGDGHIATCEVSENAIIQNVLQPDVQLFDSNGNFSPNSANTDKDSLSVGLGFTAVRATF
jgi:hypothetical protein